MPEAAYGPAEILIAAMSREIRPGDIVVQGIATPLVLTAFMLAKRRHVPELQFMYTSGCTISEKPGQVRLCGIEELTVSGCLRAFTSPVFHGDLARSLQTKEFLRPAQVDGSGRTNNVVIGSFDRPKVRLPGCGGIADITTYNPNLYLYMPRHDRRALVERVDFVSGSGRPIQALFTDLCIFDFTGGGARLRSLHPGVTLEQVRDQTGFAFSAPEAVPDTPVPDPDALRLLREEIDPLGICRVEFATRSERVPLLRELIAAEKQL